MVPLAGEASEAPRGGGVEAGEAGDAVLATCLFVEVPSACPLATEAAAALDGATAGPAVTRLATAGEAAAAFSVPLAPKLDGTPVPSADTLALASEAGVGGAGPLHLIFLWRDFFGEGVSEELLFFPALLGSGGLPSHRCCCAVASFLARSWRSIGHEPEGPSWPPYTKGTHLARNARSVQPGPK